MRLTKIPGPQEQGKLPTAKAWQHWSTVKLCAWAAARREGFDDEVRKRLTASASADANVTLPMDKDYSKVNRLLGYEISQVLDETTSTFVSGVKSSHELGLVARLRFHITQGNQTPVQRKGELAVRLNHWNEGLEELAAVGARPSRDTALQSLKALVRDIRN